MFDDQKKYILVPNKGKRGSYTIEKGPGYIPQKPRKLGEIIEEIIQHKIKEKKSV